MSQLFASGGQSTGVSASASVLPMNIQDWFPLGLTGLISLQSKGLSRVFSNTTVGKHQFFRTQPSLLSSSHICLYTTTGKILALTIWTFVGKVMSLLFNTLSRLLITFLPRSKSTVSLVLIYINCYKSSYLYFLRLFLFILYPIFGFFSSVFIFYSFHLP